MSLQILQQNPTAESVEILAECMQNLEHAQPLEGVVDSVGLAAGEGSWRVTLSSRVARLCADLKDGAVADAEGWRIVEATDSIARMKLYMYTGCPAVPAVREALHSAEQALSKQMDTLPGVLERSLGAHGQESPAPKTVDKVTKALKDAEGRGLGDRYADQLEACEKAVAEEVQRLNRDWVAALAVTDVQAASKASGALKELSKSKVVTSEIQVQGVELAVFDRQLQDAKQRIFSMDHLRDDTVQHTLAQSLAGLQAIDEAGFGQLLEAFVDGAERQAETTKGRLLAEHTGESVFAELKERMTELGAFHKKLQPHCTSHAEVVDRLAGSRGDLLEAWLQCTSGLCEKLRAPGSKDKVEDSIRCIRECGLIGDEQARVDEVVRRFENATQNEEDMRRTAIVDYEKIMRLDCAEPTSFKTMSAATIASILNGLQQSDGLLPDGISYENAVGHLQRAIRGGEEPCIEAAEAENYRRCAQYADCLNRLATVTVGEVDSSAQDVLERVKEKVTEKLQELCDHAETSFRDGLESDDSASELFQEVNASLEKLRAAQKVLKDARCFADVLKECSDTKLITMMKQHVQDSAKRTIAEIQQMEGAVSADWVAKELISLYQVPSDIADKSIKTQATKDMEKVLVAAKKKDGTFSFTDLANALIQLSGRGGEIIDLLPAFKKWKLEKFNRATAGASSGWSLDKLVELNSDLSAQQKATLERHWATYEALHSAMLDKHFTTRDVAAMVRETLACGSVVEIIAGICAVWSLAGSSADDDDSATIIRPHPVQILSIFVLLGLDRGQDLSISGHLIQVKTGQGKSVLLGVLATLLAVRGWDVDCVCYSSYLSARDEESFASVFKAFSVKDHVKYGTFNGLAESSINAKGNVRRLTDDVVVKRGPPSALPPAADRPRILLIDEVDVFFSDSFFGETYAPVTVFRNEHTDALQKYLWEQREGSNLAAMGLASPHFQALVSGYSHLKTILEGHVRRMAADVAVVRKDELTQPKFHIMQDVMQIEEEDTDELEPQPEPEPEADAANALTLSSTEARWRIGYQDQDSVSTSMWIGYETAALYLKEEHKFNEGEADHGPMDLEHALGFRIPCGVFSFAEMGRSGDGFTYAHILGVSGTIECLAEYEKKIIRETYRISKLSVAPSIYGENRMRWEPSQVDVLGDEESFHQAIQLEVSKKQKRVACLVFFQTEAKMRRYEEYLSTNQIQMANLFSVTADVDNAALDHAVTRAARLGNATLFTRLHGRGLDFACHDEQLDNNGGIHVVQTFLSEEEAEEIQIRGRSARQDKNGTYKLVLLASDLVEFGGGSADSYDDLDRKRKDFSNRRVTAREVQVAAALDSHTRSMGFAAHVRAGNFDAAMDFLNAQYKQPEKSVRFVLDYSASMSGPRSRGCLGAVDEVFQNHINGGDHVALTLFNHEVTEMLPWTQKDGNEARIQGVIAQCNAPTNRTKLWGVLEQAIDQAGSAPSAYWIVLLTDGDDTNSFEPARKSSNADEYDRLCGAHCNDRLVPALRRCAEQGTLAGLIAITAGNEVSEATKAMLRGLTAAAGVEDGLIDCANPALLQEAFGRAAAIMSNTVGRG